MKNKKNTIRILRDGNNNKWILLSLDNEPIDNDNYYKSFRLAKYVAIKKFGDVKIIKITN